MESLKEMLIRHEGWRNKPYADIKGIKTIGVGWNMVANMLPQDIYSYLRINGQITDEMIDRLLDISIECAANHCKDVFDNFDSFSERRKNALIDFMFNVGIGTFLTFKKTIAAIKKEEWEQAAVRMGQSLWAKQVGHRSNDICEMIKTG